LNTQNTFKNPLVKKVFDRYPEPFQEKLLFLRGLILNTTSVSEDIPIIQETLKWGEPSYLTEHGSTIRINWKISKPYQYAIYFHCKSKLVETFKALYGDQFTYEKNRAIIFQKNDDVPIEALKHCIMLALRYHKIKHIPMLGT
jgi:hypothetical protein